MSDTYQHIFKHSTDVVDIQCLPNAIDVCSMSWDLMNRKKGFYEKGTPSTMLE